MGNKIYTIGREFGSGEEESAKSLRNVLELSSTTKNCYSRRQRKAVSARRFSRIMMSKRDQQLFVFPGYGWVTSLNGYHSAPFLDMPLNHKVFLAQFDTIKKIAERESCVIVGRCADYALSDNPDCINIFIHADIDKRAKYLSANAPIFRKAEARDL